MVKLNTENLTNPETALKECSCYIYYCLPEREQKAAKQDWLNAGGVNNMPWWKWILNHCSVAYENK